MKNFSLKILFLISILVSFSKLNFAQNNTSNCDKYITEDFISDGQFYGTNIKYGDEKKFTLTFIKGNTYRISACSTVEKNVIFKIYDQENNLLYSNSDYNYSPYWDFEFENTIQCTLVISLATNKIVNDFASFSIGFKR